jgi:hypothetical protein
MNNLAMLAAIDKNRFDPRRRAFVLLRSGLRLDLLNPDPHAWTDEDLAAGLARTLRWDGASRWAHPLSVAQHSLTVLAIREAEELLRSAPGSITTLASSASSAAIVSGPIPPPVAA